MNYFTKLSLFLQEGQLTTSSGRRPRAGSVRPQDPKDGVRAACPGQGVLFFLERPSQPLIHAAGICQRPKVGVALAGRWGAAGTARPWVRGRRLGESFEEIYSDVLLREGHPSRSSVYKNFPAC